MSSGYLCGWAVGFQCLGGSRGVTYAPHAAQVKDTFIMCEER